MAASLRVTAPSRKCAQVSCSGKLLPCCEGPSVLGHALRPCSRPSLVQEEHGLDRSLKPACFKCRGLDVP